MNKSVFMFASSPRIIKILSHRTGLRIQPLSEKVVPTSLDRQDIFGLPLTRNENISEEVGQPEKTQTPEVPNHPEPHMQDSLRKILHENGLVNGQDLPDSQLAPALRYFLGQRSQEFQTLREGNLKLVEMCESLKAQVEAGHSRFLPPLSEVKSVCQGLSSKFGALLLLGNSVALAVLYGMYRTQIQVPAQKFEEVSTCLSETQLFAESQRKTNESLRAEIARLQLAAKTQKFAL